MKKVYQYYLVRLVIISSSLVFITTAIVPGARAQGDKLARASQVSTKGTFQREHTQASNQQAIIHVPGDVVSLQQAISQVPDGGVIEISGGVYPSPDGGFRISNLGKGFTIRAAPGGKVILDGGNARSILLYTNRDLSDGKQVQFQGLTFANGYSYNEGVAGGVTMRKAQGLFIDCLFDNNNGNQPTTSGGAVVVANQSEVYFVNTEWRNNRAKNAGAGMDIAEQALVVIDSSKFINNRTNFTGHGPTAAGGGIHLGNSKLYVHNTRFENNQAGYVGGGIYAIGTWSDPLDSPRAFVYVDSSIFINNKAARDASVSYSAPTEGGAFHAEDQTRAIIRNSRFELNQANIGGAISLYRGTVEVYESLLLGNRANGTGSANGFGGAISATSNDGNDASTGYGAFNRPAASLTLKDVVILGRHANVTVVGQAAGGIEVAGDGFRTYGIGVPKMGSLADNRAKVFIDNVVFNDLDIQETPGQSGTGIGGAIIGDLAELHMTNSLVINSDAMGSRGMGGGVMLLNQSLGVIRDSTIANNTAEWIGAGLFIQGSEISLTDCNIIENELSPGFSEPVGQSFGAGIFTSPDASRGLATSGEVVNCIISNNIGLPIFDDDIDNGPANHVQYNGNLVYSTAFGETVYTDSIPNYCCKSLPELNGLVIDRANGVSTDKSLEPNITTTYPPDVGSLVAVPDITVTNNPSLFSHYLAFAWSGRSASLDENKLSENSGLIPVAGAGIFTLSVGQVIDQVEIFELEPRLYMPLTIK